MAIIHLPRHKVEQSDLPRCCICCGQPSTRTQDREFSLLPDWVNLLFLAGLIPGLIAWLGLSRRMTVSLPLCDKHGLYTPQTPGLSRAGVAVIGGSFVLLAFWYLLPALADQLFGQQDSSLVGLLGMQTIFGHRVAAACMLLAAPLFFFLLWLVAKTLNSAWRKTNGSVESLTATEISERGITLRGVSPAFAEMVRLRQIPGHCSLFDELERVGTES